MDYFFISNLMTNQLTLDLLIKCIVVIISVKKTLRMGNKYRCSQI